MAAGDWTGNATGRPENIIWLTSSRGIRNDSCSARSNSGTLSDYLYLQVKVQAFPGAPDGVGRPASRY